MPLDQATLNQYTGTEKWTVLPVFGNWPAQEPATDPRPLATDGALYVLQNGGSAGAFWLWDMFVSHYRTNPAVRAEPFLVIELRTYHAEGEKGGRLLISDGNNKLVATQAIEYTDFDLPRIKFYFTTNVLLLPSEY